MKTAIRQKVRKTFLFASLLLFPVSMYYFSPYLPFMAAGEGIIAGSLLVFSGMFVTAMLCGRFFCGWICPAGAVQEFASEMRTKRVNRKKAGWIKYLIWIPWILFLLYALFTAGGIKKAEFLYQTEHGVSIANVAAYITYYSVIALFLIPVIIAGRRGGCHSLCWMAPFMIAGKKTGSLLTIPRLHIKRRNDDCTHCNICTNNCPMSLDVSAELEAGTLAEQTDCILCGVCVDSCPKKAMGYSFGRRK